MKEIVSRILDVIMYLIPFFGKRKRDRVVREVRYHTTCKEVCKVKPLSWLFVLGVSLLYTQVGRD